MIITALSAAAAAKWLLAGKILTAVGSFCLTVSPMIESVREKRKHQNTTH